MQYPAQARGFNKWKPKALPIFTNLLPGFTSSLKSSHCYSFPSWSERAATSRPTTSRMSGATSAMEYSSFGDSPTGEADRSTPGLHEELQQQPRRRAFRQRQSCDLGHLATGKRSSIHSSSNGVNAEKEMQMEHFQKWCETKFGHMVALWRKLDKDQNMTLSKAEFLTGLKELNYIGKPSVLWSMLDSDTTGLITITEFVPAAALQLARFKHWADTKFGSVQNAFHRFDRDRNGKMSLQEFARGCHGEDFPDELKASVLTLFDVMDDSRTCSTGKAVITADELRFLDAWKCPDYLWVAPDDAAKKAFQDALVAKHGENYIIAWRKALDKDSTMRVSFSEFTLTCKRLAKHGMAQAIPASGIAALFCAFDHTRRGWFSLREWHEESWTLLSNFKKWATEHYAKVSHWFEGLEASASGLGLGEFRRHARQLDISLKDMSPKETKEYLFEGLSLQGEAWSDEKGRWAHGTLTKAEITFLDTWDPDEEVAQAKAWDEIFQQTCEHYEKQHEHGHQSP